MVDDRNVHARRLFDGVATSYDPLAELFSFLQNGRWHRHLVSRLSLGPADRMLDLCTGTARVAIRVNRSYGCRVVGLDLSGEMLEQAQRKIRGSGAGKDVVLVRGRAESLAFADECFDAVCFTYLLRYVEDPRATLREIVRVLKPGGHLVSLEFGVPPNVLARGLWYIYTRSILPLAGALVSQGWREVGTFLGPSISRFYRLYSIERIRQMWVDLGIRDVQIERPSLGGAVVMWGTRSIGGLRSD